MDKDRKTWGEPPEIKPQSEFMTTKEVAKYLRVGTETVERFVKDGLLKQFKIGSNIRRYRKSDVDAMIEKLTSRGY